MNLIKHNKPIKQTSRPAIGTKSIRDSNRRWHAHMKKFAKRAIRCQPFRLVSGVSATSSSGLSLQPSGIRWTNSGEGCR